jgi:hypothetical protein
MDIDLVGPCKKMKMIKKYRINYEFLKSLFVCLYERLIKDFYSKFYSKSIVKI